MTGDPFGTAAIRERVLAGWAAAAVRLREDANAEEELVLGGYRDRVVVELAQNAADAATKAGVPGRLLLRLGELDGRPVLVAANTGAPLDGDGVEALSTLRASAKRDDGGERAPDVAGPVGRFGVGFASVLTVTDEPAVLSRAGGVRFSAADSRALVHELAAARPDGDLDAELARRDGHVPVLRLPFPAEGTPPAGYDTAVVLPLRDAAAHDVVLRRLGEVDDTLLLALPGLDEVVVEVPGEPPRVVRDVASRWRVLRGSGPLDAALLADRPVEERRRPAWQVTWAVPRAQADADALDAAVTDLFGTPAPRRSGPSGGAPGVVHAPTPTDEPLPWPALLLGTFPLESTRRHVVPGPLTDAIVAHAARLYADLLAELAEAGEDVLPLVPAGLAAGALDGALREAVLPLLARTPLLSSAADAAVLLRPVQACVLDLPAGREPDVVAALAVGTPGLVVRRGTAGVDAARRALGVAEVHLADAVEALPMSLTGGRPDPVDPDGSGDDEALAWHAVYQALDGLSADPLLREGLAGLPVPLADGRVVAGPRGTVLALGRPGDDLASAIAVLGVRAVHPRAAHRLLERLGATVATPRALLDLPPVRAAVAAVAAGEVPETALDDPLADPSADPDDALDAVVDAVLALVAGAVADGELGPGDLPWLGELPLVDADGEPAPAYALVVPGSAAERALEEAEFAPVADDLLRRWGADALVAAGVRAQLVVLRAQGLSLDARPDPDDVGPGDPDDLDGWADWRAYALAECARAGVDPVDAVVEEVAAVADLDAVRAVAWPQVLAWLAADREARSAVCDPARVLHPRGAVTVVPYTAWWLRRELVGGPVADPDAHPVVRQVLPPAPGEVVDLDPGLRTALGCVRSLDELGTAGLEAVLDRLADPSLELAPGQLVQAWQHVAALAEQLAAGVSGRLSSEGAAAGDVPPAPSHVRVVAGDVTVVVSAEKVTVVDKPAHLQFYAPGEVIAASPEHAAALADLLDLPLAADDVRGVVAESGDATGQLVAVPAAAGALLGLAAPGQWCEHERLVVDGAEVDWWVDDAGTVHACTLHGLALGLAWSRGRWGARHALAEVLDDPSSLARLLAEGVFG